MNLTSKSINSYHSELYYKVIYITIKNYQSSSFKDRRTGVYYSLKSCSIVVCIASLRVVYTPDNLID